VRIQFINYFHKIARQHFVFILQKNHPIIIVEGIYADVSHQLGLLLTFSGGGMTKIRFVGFG
jgi:hypothetical protein